MYYRCPSSALEFGDFAKVKYGILGKTRHYKGTTSIHS